MKKTCSSTWFPIMSNNTDSRQNRLIYYKVPLRGAARLQIPGDVCRKLKREEKKTLENYQAKNSLGASNPAGNTDQPKRADSLASIHGNILYGCGWELAKQDICHRGQLVRAGGRRTLLARIDYNRLGCRSFGIEGNPF